MRELPAAFAAMGAFRQFIVYRLVPSASRPGKTDKFPVDHLNGRVSNAHDASIWTDAPSAISAAARLGADHGVGFVLTEADPFWFLDIDDCLLPDGSDWSPLAKSLCSTLAGAAIEVSQSGRGLHIFGTGTPPPHGCKNTNLHLEFYHADRFAALTGTHAIGDAGVDCTALLPAIVATYFPPSPTAMVTGDWTVGPREDWRGPTDDDDLIRRASRSHSPTAAFGNRASFADLWSGNAEVLGRCYPAEGRPYDASSADAALAQHLAFWTGNDCARIQRLMERSALARDKWERHGSYLTRTISSAVGRQSEVLIDKEPPRVLAAPSAPGATCDLSVMALGTQDAVALGFAERFRGSLLYNHTRRKWMQWDGTRWGVEETRLAFEYARGLARTANVDGKASISSSGFAQGVEMFAQSDRAFARSGSEFDSDNYLLNTPGGTMDLRTNTLRPHDAGDHITMRTAVAPSNEGGEVFHKFLGEITCGDAQLEEFLQVSLGACLSGAVESHWLLFWIGDGRNGKNTLGDLVQDVMGDYARKVPTSTLMAKTNEGHPTEVANLQGIRLALSSEINDGEHWHEARINEVTGDATLSARFMRGDLFTFRRTHKHLIYGNHRPQLRTVGNAITSRIKIVPFKASFIGREDATLPDRLRANLGYVLGWLVDGHRKWLEAGRKLPPCEAVETESAEYFAAQSTVEMWIGECLEVIEFDLRPIVETPKASDLYRNYLEWKTARGEKPIAMTRWSEAMRRFEKVKSQGVVRYIGVRLNNANLPFG